jgi:hypothetical protein
MSSTALAQVWAAVWVLASALVWVLVMDLV